MAQRCKKMPRCGDPTLLDRWSFTVLAPHDVTSFWGPYFEVRQKYLAPESKKLLNPWELSEINGVVDVPAEAGIRRLVRPAVADTTLFPKIGVTANPDRRGGHLQRYC